MKKSKEQKAKDNEAAIKYFRQIISIIKDNPDTLTWLSFENDIQDVSKPLDIWVSNVIGPGRSLQINYLDHSLCKENKKKHDNYYCECLEQKSTT